MSGGEGKGGCTTCGILTTGMCSLQPPHPSHLAALVQLAGILCIGQAIAQATVGHCCRREKQQSVNGIMAQVLLQACVGRGQQNNPTNTCAACAAQLTRGRLPIVHLCTQGSQYTNTIQWPGGCCTRYGAL